MFKNPIKKHQSGGVTPEQARQQVVQFIIQKTGATEDQVNGFLDKISGDEKALGEFQQILELASKDDPKGIDMLKQLFGTQSSQFVKKGGKLHNFICKHAKGGVAGCGCKEDGGKVSKAQNGTSGIPQNASALDTYLMSNMQMPTSDNLFTGQQVANLINSIHLNQPLVQAQEDGGKVEMHQETNGGNGKIAVAREKYTPESYFKNRAAWLHLNNGDNYTEGRAYRPYAFGTPTAGFGGDDLEFHFVSEGLSGVPRRTVAVLNDYYDKNIPDNEIKKTFFDSEGNKNNSEDFNNRMNNLTEQMIQKMPARISYLRPGNGPDAILHENGGVVKAQGGNNENGVFPTEGTMGGELKETRPNNFFDRYRNSNTGRVLRNFRQSAPGQAILIGSSAIGGGALGKAMDAASGISKFYSMYGPIVTGGITASYADALNKQEKSNKKPNKKSK